jgi:hypothetical protein
MLRRYGASARSARAHRTYDRIMATAHGAEWSAQARNQVADTDSDDQDADQAADQDVR